MNRIKVMITNSDKDYALALCKALALKYQIFSVTVSEEGATPEKYDIFLADWELKAQAEEEEDPNRMKILGLTAAPSAAGDDGYIYKYGGLDQIASQIQIAYGNNSGTKQICLNKSKIKIIGFTSSAGGVGKSSIAVSVARELALTAKSRILYISFEETESTAVYLPVDKGRASISEYLYYLFRDENCGASYYTEAFTINDYQGLNFFRPAKGKNELPDLNCEQQLRFFNSLVESSPYDIVFIDFLFTATPETRQLASLCMKLFIIDDGTPLSIYKNNRSLWDISREGPCLPFADARGEEDMRILALTNKWEPSKDFLIPKGRICIENDPDSFELTDSKININLQRRFGIGIRRIADEIAACI
ncbi:hypothetical protein MASR2M70_02750 [Bacillota bacterium]